MQRLRNGAAKPHQPWKGLKLSAHFATLAAMLRRKAVSALEGIETHMKIIGTVASLWRYPVKSMRGEELDAAFMGFAGVYGDRLFAFRSAASPTGFPYLTGREQHEMLRYRPRFRSPEKAAQPPNLSEAERIAPGLNPIYADAADLMVDVETPSGEILAIDHPTLLRRLGDGIGERHALRLVRSDRALTDCRPVSLLSVQTVQQLGRSSLPQWTSDASGPTSMWTSPPLAASLRMIWWAAHCASDQKWCWLFWSVIRAAP